MEKPFIPLFFAQPIDVACNCYLSTNHTAALQSPRHRSVIAIFGSSSSTPFNPLSLCLCRADREAVKIPRNLEDLYHLHQVLSQYIDQHFFNVYVTFVTSFLYLQTFSIPGSMWLSVLGGALFNFWLTLLTVCACSAIGASLAFLISSRMGSKAVVYLFGERIEKWNQQLVHHKQHMFNYMIVLRISPLPPNWVVNLGAPHLGISLTTFFWGTFVGVAPLSFIQIQAGAALDRLSSSDKLSIFTPRNIACLFGLAFAALIPVFVRSHSKFRR
ncbi:hypothetical protein DM01DRAFT_272862 [Hesseltinella vesiculosa]|uniref:VTT domain-containing protein n=1 Tax=Hesseltinella vesiculosa TaxID=101127 RepID=A0A1X2GPL8_9FUNG|nr:hypothetical protein DM01DRAFT_272862 [Hesseltinella vesiculosa]